MNQNNGDRWWESLRHSGLLLGPSQALQIEEDYPLDPLSDYKVDKLRRELNRHEAEQLQSGELVAWTMQSIFGFPGELTGRWKRQKGIKGDYSHILASGESSKPDHVWEGSKGGRLAVFIDKNPRLGIGRGRKTASDVVQWLRLAQQPLALLTNARQWRLVHAGLDYDAYCESDTELWFEEGQPGPQLKAMCQLLQPVLFEPPEKDADPPLAKAIADSRRGQSELSSLLGERVREAVEELVRAHGELLKEADLEQNGAEIYRAAVRMVMRMVVVLFAESRDLLPRDNPVYNHSYGLQALFGQLERLAARGRSRLQHRCGAWPRILALFNLIYNGSHHEALPVMAYGGDLFAPGDPESDDPMVRAVSVFEAGCFSAYGDPVMPDSVVHSMLKLLTRTPVKLPAGWAMCPVDFSDLSSEYIGILYEGLLDYELRTAPDDQPIVFVAVGNEPALPLARLEGMEDKQLKELFEKLKKATKDEGEDADEEDSEADADGDEASEEAEAGSDEATDEEGAPSEEDDSEQESVAAEARRRAHEWAKRACIAAKLVKRPRGRMTAEKQLKFESDIESMARKLCRRVVVPGEWYLVRWGGTRKGSGSFYTRPDLAIPLTQRTLRPLAYDGPRDENGVLKEDIATEDWKPRKPEDILALKICDPACGSGSFLIAGLRFLTDALYAALFEHDRLSEDGDRTLVGLLSTPTKKAADSGGSELIPCRPDDEYFEPRVKAVLKRYVVERCVYGVDIDPLAAELCRMALWIETLDRSLPFTFLDHKIRSGNSLVGCWLDAFAHYPVMAFSRDGGDAKHKNGVHLEEAARTKALTAFSKGLKVELVSLIEGGNLFDQAGVADVTGQMPAIRETVLDLHNLGILDVAERQEAYAALRHDPRFKDLKAILDLWCSLWFWPADQLEYAPSPSAYASGEIPEDAWLIARQVAGSLRFFHWELEFPDVFIGDARGFDAILANPPWDISKPHSKEFFSRHDPLYLAATGDTAKIQKSMFENEPKIEYAWLDYGEHYNAFSNWARSAGLPFGDRVSYDKQGRASHDFSLGDGGRRSREQSERRHQHWRTAREECEPIAVHPFRLQSSGDINLYKLFVEMVADLLSNAGRYGMLVPAAIYNDSGSAGLRRKLIVDGSVEWLFSFENRRKIFPIDPRFRFCCIIGRSQESITPIALSFGNLRTEGWSQSHPPAIKAAPVDLAPLSPLSSSIPEVETDMDMRILKSLYKRHGILGNKDASTWGTDYNREFDMTNARKKKLFMPLEACVADPDGPQDFGLWSDSGGICCFYTGKMEEQFDFCYQRWVSGRGNHAKWEALRHGQKAWRSEFAMPITNTKHRWHGGTRVVFRDMTNATNERTTLAAVIPAWPCGNKLPILAEDGVVSVPRQLMLCAFLNSFPFDYVVRRRMTGINLNLFILEEACVPTPESALPLLDIAAARLSLCHSVFSRPWLELAEQHPFLADHNCDAWWAVSTAERLRLRAICEALVAVSYGLSWEELRWMLTDCDEPKSRLEQKSFRSTLNPKGFWRIGVGDATHPWRKAWSCDPEVRLPVLALVAYRDLLNQVADGREIDADIAAGFVGQQPDAGWQLPEVLRLSDYGLGCDARAQDEQPVRTVLSELDDERPSAFTWKDCANTAERLRVAWGTEDSGDESPASENERSDTATQGFLWKDMT